MFTGKQNVIRLTIYQRPICIRNAERILKRTSVSSDWGRQKSKISRRNSPTVCWIELASYR